jgi:vacuolar protein sorting-associated protein IST1
MDTALDEAAVAVFYAWHRFPHELRELTMLRTMLGERYGKEFMAMAQDNKVEGVTVPDRLIKGLRVRPPTQELVESYLREIAKAYGVAWPEGEEEQAGLGSAPPEFVDESATSDPRGGDQGDDENQGGGGGDVPSTPSKESPSQTRRASETSELNKATPPRGSMAGRSPVSVAPPGPRSDNPNPRVKVPGSEEEKDSGSVAKTEGTAKNKGNGNGIPELDELTRRFADLKRKP